MTNQKAHLIDFVVGSHPHYESEVRPRLRQRLMWFLIIVLIVGALQGVWQLYRSLSSGHVAYGAMALMGIRMSVLIVGILLLWRGTGLSLKRLRQIESVIVFASVFFHGTSVYVWLTAGQVTAQLSPALGSGSALVSVWYIAPGQGVSIPEGMALGLIAFTLALPMACLLSGYGGLIPSTRRRSVYLVALTYADALVPTLAAAFSLRPVFWQLVQVAGLEVLILTPFAALCIAAVQKLDTLSRELFQARRLGQYTLVRKLGAGGMGDVYLARHQFLRRPCAVKLIRPELGLDPSLLVRFEREVQAMAGLSHPNAVEIFDYGRTDDGTFYYVMEFVPGLDLAELVRGYGPVPAGRVVFLLRQACDALLEAHAVGLIHRDIKPSNLLLCESGQRADVIKLLDFGLVQRVGGAEAEATPASRNEPADQDAAAAQHKDALALQVTRAGSLLGTPAFMSPEQIIAKGPLDARSDIYSLGCLAYFLLAGRPPFVTETTIEVLTAHMAEPAQPPSAHQSDVPADLEAVVMRCLEKQPEARYADVAALASALASCACIRDWDGVRAAAWWRQHRERAVEPVAPIALPAEDVGATLDAAPMTLRVP